MRVLSAAARLARMWLETKMCSCASGAPFHHQRQLPATVVLRGWTFRLGRRNQSRALPVGNPSVRMRNDRHEPNGTKRQRTECIPIDPEHRSCSRDATAAVAIDSLLQNSRRREHDYATRRIRRLGTDLWIAADTPTFLDFACHGPVSLQFQNFRSPEKCASRHWNVSPGQASVYESVVPVGERWRVSSGGGSPERAGFPRFASSPGEPLRISNAAPATSFAGSPLSRCRCRASRMTCHTDRCRSRNSRRNHAFHGHSDLGPCPPCEFRRSQPCDLRQSHRHDLRRYRPWNLR
jgi:hypothetical protein